ncbi:MAG: chaperone NapD [Phyllobacterium sp.]
MSEQDRFHHISSAVISVLPGRMTHVLALLEQMPDLEVSAHDAGKIVVVLEGNSTGALGERLTHIALLDGVITANMVFEHIEKLEAAQT